jgi:tRNA(fMet)-specific endonuclease VapC
MTYLLDTDICSYAIKKDENVVKNIILHEQDSLCISSITCAELMFGAVWKKSSRLSSAVKELIDRFHIIDFDKKSAEEYAAIRDFLESKGIPIGNMDLLIAATAKSAKAVIVTNNEKHYRGIPGLEVENWFVS